MRAPDARDWFPIAKTNGAILTWTDALGGFESLAGRSFNTQLPAHVHPSYVIGVVHAGAVRVTRGQVSTVATAGDVIALAPFEVHTEIAQGHEGWSFTYLYPAERNVREALRVAMTPGDTQAVLRFPNPVIRNERIQRAVEIAHQLMMLRAARRIVEMALASLFELLAAESVAGMSSEKQPRYRRGIDAARSIILQEPAPGQTLSQLARMAGMSVSHFDRVFHSEVGIAPGGFFQRVRVARAYAMILHGHRLSDVWLRLGYSDQAHMTRHFHASSALTPGQYATIVRAARRPA